MICTRTQTITTTRQAAVFWQFQWILVQILPHGEDSFKQFVRPALEQGVLKSVQFYAYDSDDSERAELSLLADWKEHQHRLHEGKEFTVPTGWRDEISPQLRLGVKEFTLQVDKEDLSVEAGMSLLQGRRLEGAPPLSRRSKPRLATGRLMCDEQLRHLTELRLFFALAND